MTRTVSRALAIFDAFDGAHLNLSLQEIADRIAMPKATTFRLVNTLEREGFLVRKQNGRYCLSLKIVRLAGLVEDTMTVREAARSVLAELCRSTGETITLSSRIGAERIVIDVADTPSPLMAVVRPGERIPLLYGAAGRVLLAFMDEAGREELLAAQDGIPDGLGADLAAIREHGYALTSGQRVPGLTAIAVPIFDHSGAVTHCVSLSGPTIRVEHREPALIEALREAGDRISRRLGKPVPKARTA